MSELFRDSAAPLQSSTKEEGDLLATSLGEEEALGGASSVE